MDLHFSPMREQEDLKNVKRESYRVVVLAVSALQTSIKVLSFNEANLHPYVGMPLPTAIPKTTSMNHRRGMPPRRTFLVSLTIDPSELLFSKY
jgi:hypothetical protein